MTLTRTNFLSPNDFGFKIEKAPHLEYNAQSIIIPGLTLGVAYLPSPLVRIPNPGNLSYGELSVAFKVDENLENYLEIFNWMERLGHPDKLEDQYAYSVSDCKALIYSSSKKPNYLVSFTDCFPTGLSPLEFGTTNDNIEYVTSSVTFTFLRFGFEKYDPT